jgi:transcriptional regulator with XRE-family HTH domain
MSAERPRSFDATRFFSDLDAVRQGRGLTWRSVAHEAGVSASTLTRMGQGRRPDVDSYAALLAWAGLRGEDYLRDLQRPVAPGTVEEIAVLLRHDPQLSDGAAEAIQLLVRASYEQLRESG